LGVLCYKLNDEHRLQSREDGYNKLCLQLLTAVFVVYTPERLGRETEVGAVDGHRVGPVSSVRADCGESVAVRRVIVLAATALSTNEVTAPDVLRSATVRFTAMSSRCLNKPATSKLSLTTLYGRGNEYWLLTGPTVLSKLGLTLASGSKATDFVVEAKFSFFCLRRRNSSLLAVAFASLQCLK